MPLSEIYNTDCLAAMREMPDNAFDLAIVDPPYGIGASEMTMGSGKNKLFKKGKKWDELMPDEEYFLHLIRVSKKQIVWGAIISRHTFHHLRIGYTGINVCPNLFLLLLESWLGLHFRGP